MKLIEDLGTRPTKTGRTERFGIYECPDCGIHFQCKTASVKSGRSTRCKACGKLVSALAMSNTQRQRAADTFIDKANAHHDFKYTYDKVEYTGALNKVIITCKIHGDFEQRPTDHLNKCGCKKCSTVDTQTFIAQATKVHGDTYDYSLVTYKDAYTKIEIICREHGVFKQSPSNHKQGNGCPKCSWDRSNIATRTHSTLPTSLYYIYLPKYNLWKIGCTRKQVTERFGNVEVELLELINFEYGGDAYRLESIMLTNLKGLRYSGQKILRGGNTELLIQHIDFGQVLGDAYVKYLQEYLVAPVPPQG